VLNKVAKLALVSTSLAPICLTLWFVEFSKSWDWHEGLGLFGNGLIAKFALLDIDTDGGTQAGSLAGENQIDQDGRQGNRKRPCFQAQNSGAERHCRAG
jgi:hypothetical protein